MSILIKFLFKFNKQSTQLNIYFPCISHIFHLTNLDNAIAAFFCTLSAAASSAGVRTPSSTAFVSSILARNSTPSTAWISARQIELAAMLASTVTTCKAKE